MKYRFIDNDNELSQVRSEIGNAGVIGLDTEFVAEDCFRPDLCLVQVSTVDSIYVIDPRTISQMSEFWELFVTPHRTVIVHAGREEILFVFRQTGRTIPKLFDIQIAAGILGGEYPASYANLLYRMLGVTLNKGETRTDWRRRPLSTDQLEYAAMDVSDLPRLHGMLVQELDALGRSQWMEDEIRLWQQDLITSFQSEGWHRIGGVQSMRGRQLAIVRELWRWRERVAEQRDMPARRVLRDDLIVELAKRGSADPKKIGNIRGLHHAGLQRMIPDLAKCVADGLIASEPRLPWSSTSKKYRSSALLLQFLNAAMAYLCRCNKIAPAIVGTSDDVRELITYWLNAKEDSQAPLPSLLVGWRGELIGRPLHEIYTGRKALRVNCPMDDMPLELCEYSSKDQ